MIANIVVDYYGISYQLQHWSGMVFLLWYIVFVGPATYVIEKWGIRRVALIGSLGSSVGAWVKVASIKPNRFWVILLGQSIVAITQPVISSIPATVAATWFGAEQVSTACSIGTLGVQLGIATGCFISPMIVKKSTNKEVIEQGFYSLNMGVAVATSVVFLLVLVGFKNKPPVPPSRAQLISTRQTIHITKSVKRLFKNVPFVMFLVAYSFNIGIFWVTNVMLNQILISVYPDAALDIGRLGTLFVLIGIVGCVFFGAVLDKYRSFKITSLFLFAISTITLTIFSLCIEQGIGYQYAIISLIGFFNNAILPIGLEVAAEITYPGPPSVFTSLLLISSKIVGILLVHLQTFLLSTYSGFQVYLTIPGVALLSTVIIMFTRFDLKRQAAGNVVSTCDNNDVC